MKIVLIALGLVALILVAFIVMGIQSRGGSALGMRDTRLSPCGPNPNCVSSGAVSDSSHYVAGFAITSGEEDAAWTSLIEAIAAAGGEITQNSPPYLAATFSSAMFGFVDDFECLIDRNAGLIHVRSGARVGYSDMNVNRERVESIRSQLGDR